MQSAAAKLLTVDEAGSLLGVSESTVWRMVRKGSLPSVRSGGRRLIPQEALERQAQSRQEDTVPPLTENHPIFRLVGAGKGGGSEPGARDKYALLARK